MAPFNASCRRIGQAVPPGPPGRWLLGNLLEFRNDPLGFLERCRRDYGGVVSLRMGQRRTVLVSEPDTIEEVLVARNHDYRKHLGARLLSPVLGNGLLLSEGDAWLRQRRLMQPAFSRRMSEAFVAIVARQTERLASIWHCTPRRDVYRDMTTLTAAVACEAFLGVDAPNEQAALSEAMDCIHADYERRIRSLFCWPLWIPTPANLRLRRAIRTLDGIIGRIIAARSAGPCDGADALSLLLKVRRADGAAMSDRRLRDEVMTLLLAGHDTTANTLSWCWLLLSQHPHALQRLRDEALDVCGGGVPGARDLPHLRFTRNVVQETMRLYPPVWAFGREAVRDTTIAGYRIERGTSVLLCQWLVQRDPRWFEQPDRFLPERWEEEDTRRPRYAYFPFGGGPRVCIGKDLALVEADAILALLAARYDVVLDPRQTIVPWPTVTLRPRHGMRAVAHYRRPVQALRA